LTGTECQTTPKQSCYRTTLATHRWYLVNSFTRVLIFKKIKKKYTQILIEKKERIEKRRNEYPLKKQN
jgi:hypothetical protein